MHDVPVFAADWAGEVLSELHRLRGARAASNRTPASDWEDPLVAHFESRVDPERPGTRSRLGQALCLAGRMHEAIEQFQACRATPELALAAWNWLGICSASMQGFNSEQMAILNFRKGLELEGYPAIDYLALHVNVALMLERVGLFAEAARHYEIVHVQSPGYYEADKRRTDALRLQSMCDQRGGMMMRGGLPVAHTVHMERGRQTSAARRRNW